MTRLLPVVLALLGLVLSGCTSVQGTEGKEFVGADFQYSEIAPADRGAPVESSGDSVEGGPVEIADYRGKVLVVNVWWSGCGPCVTELPLLVDAVATLGPEVDLVGINTRDASPDNAATFERGLGVDFPSIYAPGGENLLDFGSEVNPRAIPSTMVLDRQGRLAALISGPIPTAQTLVSLVDEVVGETGG